MFLQSSLTCCQEVQRSMVYNLFYGHVIAIRHCRSGVNAIISSTVHILFNYLVSTNDYTRWLQILAIAIRKSLETCEA